MWPRRVMPGLGVSGLGVSAAREREVRRRRRMVVKSFMVSKELLEGWRQGAMGRKGAKWILAIGALCILGVAQETWRCRLQDRLRLICVSSSFGELGRFMGKPAIHHLAASRMGEVLAAAEFE